jgi:hypothetical protein
MPMLPNTNQRHRDADADSDTVDRDDHGLAARLDRQSWRQLVRCLAMVRRGENAIPPGTDVHGPLHRECWFASDLAQARRGDFR